MTNLIRHRFRRRSLRLVAVIYGALALFLVSGAQAADPMSVLTIKGSCESGEPLFVQTPDRPYLMRVSSPASALQLFIGYGVDVAAGDTRWILVNDFNSDFNVLYYSCSSGEWTGWLYAIPAAPTRFSGQSTVSPYDTVDTTSEMAFRAPAGARYSASVTPRQGAVSLLLDRGTPVPTFVSPGTHDLGFVRGGDSILLGIRPVDGPPAIWDVSITPQPIRLGGSSVDHRFVRPGQIVTTRYSVSGDAKLDVGVRQGTWVVRQLAVATNVTAGPHSIAWDALDGRGRPVADGVYAIDLTVNDIFGTTDKTMASVTVDSHPPQVIFQSPRIVSPRHGVVFRIVDRLSGYRSGSVKVDGRSAGFRITRAGVNRFVVSSAAGWATGFHRVTVTAFDRIGNRTQASRGFTVK